MTDFPPNRDAALDRLNDFLPSAGISYAKRRNYDVPGHAGVSRLSPYLRHRVITEQEVLAATLTLHSPTEAEKFIAEVCWRTYWKGVLELRPSLWMVYQTDLNAAWNTIQTNSGLRTEWEAACNGDTGIDCFDHWAHELVETGYLHNHARMWFASIWIFTLRLPWALGADFFLRHLLDGDPASNTLSWRWVGGLQTRGKTYLARADNIAKYTEGRFNPQGLATQATPLDGPPLPPPAHAPLSDPKPKGSEIGVLITEDDLCPDWLCDVSPKAFAILAPQTTFGPLQTAPRVKAFKAACMDDLSSRLKGPKTPVERVADVVNWAQNHDLQTVTMAIAPTGPAQQTLAMLRSALQDAGIALSVQIRSYDSTAWPNATHGYFRFKNVIPSLLP